MTRIIPHQANLTLMSGFAFVTNANGNLQYQDGGNNYLWHWDARTAPLSSHNALVFDANGLDYSDSTTVAGIQTDTETPRNAFTNITNKGGWRFGLASGSVTGLQVGSTSSTNFSSKFTAAQGSFGVINNVKTVGLGIPCQYGIDERTGLTSADGSPITLYTTTAAGQVYAITARILATAGSTPSATYTIKWTESGTVITKTLTISSLNADADLPRQLIQPGNSTNITAQLTAISGSGTTVNVACLVEEVY